MPISPRATPEAVAAYCARIGFDGEARPDLATLKALHRLHLQAIPWENLDVQLGRPVGRDPRAAFAKLVGARRGGWCFEMNGLFGWILEAIGFRVTRLAGAVMREQVGDEMIGNHLVLIVELDRPWIADVGLGNGLIEPVPLAEGPIVQGFKAMALERIADGWWRFRNAPGMAPPSFDFSLEVRDEALLEDRCRWLQSDPTSPFVINAVLQRHFPDRVESLAGTVHTVFSNEGAKPRTLADGADYVATLRERFGLDLAEAERLWPRISARPLPDIPAAA